MQRLLIAVLVAITFQISFGQKKSSSTDPRLAGLDADLQKVLDTWKAAGFAVAVVEKNKVIYAKGFGYRDYEKKLPVTPNTLFAIGSCTKAFTSSLLGILREQGKVDLNESPRKYLPNLKFYNAEMDNNIIIKDLMSHRTGLPRHDYSWYIFQTSNRDSLVARIAYLKPFTGVRKSWYYNNFMFLVQGVITEHLTDMSWENNIREKLLKPLNMTTSNVSISELEKAMEPAIGYGLEKGKIHKMKYYDIAAMSPAGSINSSVNEMSNWVRAWMYGGKLDGKEIVPASYVREAISSQMVVGEGLPDPEHPDIQFSTYGYGWFLGSYKGHYRVEHGGNIDGFSASTSFFPRDSVGIVVLVNQNSSVVPGLVRNIIADRMLKTSRTDWNKEDKDRRDNAEKEAASASKAKSTSNVKGTKTSHAITDYAGRFGCQGYGELTVTSKQDSLFIQFKTMKIWLRHKHYDVFDAIPVTDQGIDTTNVLDTNFNYRTNDFGEIAMITLKLEPTVDALEFKRVPLLTPVDKSLLGKYAGDYEVGGMTAHVFVKNEKTLALTVPGQPEYELIPNGPNKFILKNMEGFKCEFIESNGVFSEMVFIQPNGTFKAKRK
ncbi:MAG: serine hydrolase [Chryseolinea sp.]